MSSKIPFSETETPKRFDLITDWYKPLALQFAVDQLETSDKKYSIEKRGKLIRIWSKTFSRNY
jgi:hypothetical protein